MLICKHSLDEYHRSIVHESSPNSRNKIGAVKICIKHRKWILRFSHQVSLFTTSGKCFSNDLDYAKNDGAMAIESSRRFMGDSRARNDWIIVRKKKFESLDWRWKFISINDRRWQSAINESIYWETIFQLHEFHVAAFKCTLRKLCCRVDRYQREIAEIMTHDLDVCYNHKHARLSRELNFQ